MASASSELASTILQAGALASARGETATGLNHLLAALLSNASAEAALVECQVDPDLFGRIIWELIDPLPVRWMLRLVLVHHQEMQPSIGFLQAPRPGLSRLADRKWKAMTSFWPSWTIARLQTKASRVPRRSCVTWVSTSDGSLLGSITASRVAYLCHPTGMKMTTGRTQTSPYLLRSRQRPLGRSFPNRDRRLCGSAQEKAVSSRSATGIALLTHLKRILIAGASRWWIRCARCSQKAASWRRAPTTPT